MSILDRCGIICINSVKGGAGKTTIALSLAYSLMMDLNAKYRANKKDQLGKNSEIKEPKVCYIDLDIMGTGAKHIIYGENYTRDDIKYLNDVKSTNQNFREILNNAYIGKKLHIDCILMNADPEEKNKFVKNARLYTSTVNINLFGSIAKKIINEMILCGLYDFIIIDCAPSYESFARSIYDYLIKDIKSRFKEEVHVYNLFISTLDKAHVMNTISCVYNIINTTEYNSNIKMVLNDTQNYFQNNEPQEFVMKVANRYISLCEEKMRTMQDKHNHSLCEFFSKEEVGTTRDRYNNSENEFEGFIVVKRYSEIVKSMFFGNEKQLNGTNLWEDIDDPNLINALGLL
jgi:cellulose biosynthesis protein BcsQ